MSKLESDGPLVFISYRREEPWTQMAVSLVRKLRTISDDVGFEVYFDEQMRAGAEWRKEVEAHLDRATHLIVLLSDPYWLSSECRRELCWVIGRHDRALAEHQPPPRLLFVQAGHMDIAGLSFDDVCEERLEIGQGARIRKVDEVNFLGPFDGNGRLEVLDWNDAYVRDKQLAQLRDRVKRTLETDRR